MSRRGEQRSSGLLARVTRALRIVEPDRLEPGVAERLITAQFEAATRHSLLMLVGNLGNAAVLLFVAAGGRSFALALGWATALGLLLSPFKLRWRRAPRSPKAPVVSARTLKKLIVNAGWLGGLWGLAPLLFLDAGAGSRMIVAMVTAGMLCGGALGLAAIPFAVVAYTLPIGLGFILALILSGAAQLALSALLTLAYVGVLIAASVSLARSFAETVTARARAETAARHDPLTGLPNRLAFETMLAESLGRLERYGEPFAVLLIRLDDLAAVNFGWGRQAGDELLRQAAVRLRDSLDERCAAARLGGGKFVVIARKSADSFDARALVADIATRLDKAFMLETNLVSCRSTVGLAFAPEDGDDAETLVARADPDNHDPAAGGGAGDAAGAIRSHASRRRELTREMRNSLARGEFLLHYQPIMAAGSGRIEAFEALARWRHPTLGAIPPAEFIDIAEKTGFIHDLGEWILNEAMREAAAWPEPARVAINVSGEQLCDVRFEALFDRAVAESGIDPARVQIEVTESASLAAVDKASFALEALNARGVAIVLDDFGVGYSSLVQVGRLPIRRLKIDRGFVAGLPLERKSAAIVETVIALARALDLSVTAEGVETEAQRAYLAQAGVDSLQGYLISRPIDATAARALLDLQAEARGALAA